MTASERRRRFYALILLTSWLPGGCYAYVPLAQPQVAPASQLQAAPAAQLRARLREGAELRLTSVTVNDVGTVEGELVSMNDTTLVVSATRVVARSGFEHLGEHATVQVPRANIASLEVRRLARGRTIAFVGGLVAFAGITSAAFATGGFFGSSSGGGKQPH